MSKVYLSFSKKSPIEKSKSDVFDHLASFNWRAYAYWGGNYDIDDLLSDKDLIVAISSEITTHCPYLSKGVYEELKYGLNHNIPCYILADKEKGWFRRVSEVYIHEEDSWDKKYGLAHLNSNNFTIEHLESMFAQEEQVPVEQSNQLILATYLYV